MSRATFSTTLLWHDSRGGEVETDALVTYSFYSGYTGDRINPPEPASVEIAEIVPSDLSITIPQHFYSNAELEDECMEDWSARIADAAERRAEAARDDRMMERF